MNPDNLAQYASLAGGAGSFALMLVFVVRVFKSLLAESRASAVLAMAEADRLRLENAKLRAERDALAARLAELS